MSKYKILIFDLDDTLIDNLLNVKHAFKKMLEQFNEEYSEEDFERWYNLDKQFWKDRQDGKIVVPNEYNEPLKLRQQWVRSQRHLIYYDYKISLEEAMRINDIYIEALNEVVIPILGAKEVIEYLSLKYVIVVATNGPSSAAKSKFEKIGISSYVTHLFAADMFGYMKPKKEFFDAVKNYIGEGDSSKYLVIGDSLKSDVGGANNALMDSCWFDIENTDDSLDYKPTMIIKELSDLKDIL